MSSSAPRHQAPSPWFRWGIVFAATFVLAVASGGRFLVGVVFDQLRETFNASHGTIGLVVSVNVLLIAVMQPLVGWLVDKVPARYVTGGGIALLGLGLVITGLSGSLFVLFLGYGGVVALGLAAVSPVAVTPLVAGWFEKRRATALSIVNAGGSIGQLAIVPGLTLAVTAIGWRDAYAYLGIGLAVIGAPILLLMLRERQEAPDTKPKPITGCTVREALVQRSFWQLAFGFFVCGFTMSWVMTFFVDYSLETGLTRGAAATGLSLMGGMSIVGALTTGWWADKVGITIPLAVVYALRGAGFGLLFLAGNGVLVLIAAMAVIGFSWSATIPLTSALCADVYGRRYLGTIFGLMFAIMPLGSAVGSGASGYLHDFTGSYNLSIWINLFLGLSAGLIVAAVRSQPIFQSSPAVRQERDQATVHAD